MNDATSQDSPYLDSDVVGAASASVLENFQITPEDMPAFVERLGPDLDLWASFCLPHVSSLKFPKFYHTVWALMRNKLIELLRLQDVIYRFALGLPRGHAKTTFLKLLIANCLVFKIRDFPLVVGSNERLAERVVADVVDILDSPNVVAVFGSFSPGLTKDTQSLKMGWYRGREVVLAAIGAGTSTRGINIYNMRPDLVAMDDMQSRENAESPAERSSLERWAVATLFKVVAPRGAFLFYIGNMYNEECMLYKFQQSLQWVTLVTGAFLADGTVLWPEHKSAAVLREEWQHDVSLGMGDIFYAEVQNDPKSVSMSLLQGGTLKMVEKPEYFDATFITVDPSGMKKHSDTNAIIVHGVQSEVGYVLDADDKQRIPIDVVRKIIEFAVRYQVSVIGIESVAYQGTLMFWIDFVREQMGLEDFPFIIELSAWGRNKELRINSWVQAAMSGMYHICGDHAFGLILREALSYRFGAGDNKDNVLDAAAYGLDVIHRNKPQLMRGATAHSFEEQGEVLSGCVLDRQVFRSV